jgi:hypothetical protein
VEVDDSNLINSPHGENWMILLDHKVLLFFSFIITLLGHKVLDWILFNGPRLKNMNHAFNCF